jgi:hypothetical protein
MQASDCQCKPLTQITLYLFIKRFIQLEPDMAATAFTIGKIKKR